MIKASRWSRVLCGGAREQIVRSALVQAGGANEVLVAGFTVGDLREHAIGGTVSRALSLGRAFEATGPGAATGSRTIWV